jgi:Trk-type K+ transport system membrane component
MEIIATLQNWLGPHAQQYLRAFLLVLGGLVVLLIVNAILKRRIRKLEERQSTAEERSKSRALPILRFFQRIAIPLAFLGILSIGVKIVAFDERI